MKKEDIADIMETIQMAVFICIRIVEKIDDSEHCLFTLGANVILLLTAISGFWIIRMWHISWKKSIFFFSVAFMVFSLLSIYYCLA